MNKLIIYGDIHGCYKEFKSLRKNINPQINDIEVCVGDIITKGKDSIKTLRYIQEHNIQSVLGNHEDKIIRYLEHEKFTKKNPITLDIDEQKIVNQLDEKDIIFLKNMPLYLKFGKVTVLHGGIQNHQKLSEITKKEKSKILRMRYLDKEQNFITYGKENKDSIFWADIYDGNQGCIVHGHQWFKEPYVGKHTIGIDTGCVYGNKLSAVIFEESNSSNYTFESVAKLDI
jgi:bis(5'-nucleosyl)-tetraphosphatase (symmetrical)